MSSQTSTSVVEVRDAILAKIAKRLEEDDANRISEVRILAESFRALSVD